MSDLGNLFLALLIINALIMTFTVRKLTNYNIIRCLFLGILSGGPLMFMGVVRVFDFISKVLMEMALLLGGSSTSEILQEFVQKYSDKKGSGDMGDE